MILYVTKRSGFDIAAIAHLNALKEIYGADQVVTLDFRPAEARRE